MKKSAFFVFISGLGWGIYWGLSCVGVYDLKCTLGESGYLWLVSPVKVLLVKILIAEAIIFSFWILTGYMKRDHKKRLIALQKDAYTYLPAVVLLISVGQFLPPANRFLGVPKFFVQDLGPLLPLLVMGTTLYLKFSRRIIAVWRWSAFRIEQYSPLKISCLIFFATLAVYIFFSLRLVPVNAPKNERYYLLTGDEPQYLLIAHSIAYDGDLNLYNNEKNGDSLIFYDRVINGFSGGTGLFGKFARGRKFTAEKQYWQKKRYSIFRPGLSILLSPWYKLGLIWDNQVRLAVVVFLNFLTSLFVINLFFLSYLITRDKFNSLIITIFAAFSMPVLFYSARIFTELPAAVLLVYSFRKIYEKSFRGFTEVLLIGVCISYLPWLHEKFLFLAGPLLVFLIYQCRKEKNKLKILTASLVPLSVSVCLLMRHYYLLFGVPYPVNMHPGFSVIGFIRGFFALWLSESHGLFAYSPVYIISIIGFFLIFKERRWDLAWFIIVPFFYLIAISSFEQWYGGLCPPGRFLMPVISFLVPIAVYGYHKIRSISFRVIAVLLGAISVAVGVSSMTLPGRLYKYKHSLIPYSERINLKGFFPNLLEPDAGQYRLVVIWMLFIIIFVILYAYYNFSAKKRINVAGWFKGYFVIFFGLIILNLVHVETNRQWTEMDKLVFYQELTQEDQIAVFAEAERPKYRLVKDRKSFINPPSVNYEAEHLLLNRTNVVSDESASNKGAVCGKTGKFAPGFLVYGPYEKFPPGNYKVSFRMKAPYNRTKEKIAIVDVVSDKGTVTHGKKEIKSADFSEINRYQYISFTFNLTREVSDIEFRVYFTGKKDIIVDKITLVPVDND